MSMPTPPLAAISAAADVRPAAPRSWSATSRPRSSSSSEHSISFFSANGSPICTLGRLASSPSPSSALASTDAPPIPSRPVAEPSRTTRCPARRRPRARVLAARQPDAHRVDQAVLLVGRLEVDLAADGRHADRVAVVADAGDHVVEQVARALAASPSSPKRSESSTAIGRAPTAKTSRRIPPTPVAAPWNGSTALGWLCDSTLNATRPAVADVDGAGVLARAHHARAGPSVGSVRSSGASACRSSAPTTAARSIASSTAVGVAPEAARRSARTRTR